MFNGPEGLLNTPLGFAMRAFFLGLILALMFQDASATIYHTPPLEKLVLRADHIFRATIEFVEVIDRNGDVVIDYGAWVGRGGFVRYQVAVNKNGVLRTELVSIPDKIVIDMYTKSHIRVYQVRSVINKEVILLLSGKLGKIVRVSDGSGWMQSLSKEEEIANIIEKQPKGRLRHVVSPPPPTLKE